MLLFLQSEDVQIYLTKNPGKKPENPAILKFGHQFTDHMLEIPWSQAKGWGRPVISPVHDLQIHPGAKVLHYATEVGWVNLENNLGSLCLTTFFLPDHIIMISVMGALVFFYIEDSNLHV